MDSRPVKLVTTKDAADMLGLPEGTLKGWRSRDIGPKYVKMGRDVRYDVADLADYVRVNKRVPSVRALVEEHGAL